MGGGKVSLPATFPILEIEIKDLHLGDTEPTPADGYEVLLVKDLGYTKVWIEFKVIEH